eukprot:6872970-Prymnesium_polylepis.1
MELEVDVVVDVAPADEADRAHLPIVRQVAEFKVALDLQLDLLGPPDVAGGVDPVRGVQHLLRAVHVDEGHPRRPQIGLGRPFEAELSF